VLFKLDDRPFRIAVEEATAMLAAAKLQVEALKATYRLKAADAKRRKTRSPITSAIRAATPARRQRHRLAAGLRPVAEWATGGAAEGGLDAE